MPFVKCRYYKESGEPVRGGCHKKAAGNCPFIHPDDPDWNKARPANAPRPSGDQGGFKPRSERSNRGAAPPSAWDTGGGAKSSIVEPANTNDGWGTGWGTDSGNGWARTGWGTEDSTTSSPNRVSEPAPPMNLPTNGWGQADSASTSSGRTRDNENTRTVVESGWGSSGWGNDKDADKNAGSSSGNAQNDGWGGGWGGKDADKGAASSGNAQNDGWGGGWGGSRDADKGAASSRNAQNDGWGGGWGNNKDAGSASEHARNDGRGGGWGNSEDTNKDAGSVSGNARNDGWGGGGWGNAKDTSAASGNAQNDGWGRGGWGNSEDANKDVGSASENTQNSGWGSWGNKATTKTTDSSDLMVVDNNPEKEAGWNNGTRKAVPAPPRIRIPDGENRKARTTTSTNNEPLGPSKWKDSRVSNVASASTPVTASTPITALTPTDPIRAKRKRDAAFDDKLDVFKEYIKSWERGVRARYLLEEAETKRDRWFHTQKSATYARIGEAGRKRLDGQRTECDQEVISQREKLSAAITSLVEFHDAHSSKLDLGQRYDVGEEAQKFMVDSRAFVDEIRALLVAQVLKDKNNVRPDDTQQHPSEVNPTSLDSLQSKFQDLEERLDQAEAELTLRRQCDIRSEIDELLATKIADLRVARQREIDRITSQPRPEIVIPPAALLKIERTAQQVREMDARMPHTVEDIRVLLLRVDATTKRVDELEKELSTNKETYKKQIQEMAAEKEKVVHRVDERIEKIRDQFEQLVALQHPGVGSAQQAISPTVYDSGDRLMESLGPAFEAILDKFYEQEVRPAIGSMQQNVISASDRLQEEAIQVLWGRIKPAMSMVAEVSQWLDSQELGYTAPVEGGT